MQILQVLAILTDIRVMDAQFSNTLQIEKNLHLVFGKHIAVGSLEAKSLTRSDLKKAYFKKAKETHPDRAACVGIPVAILEQRFKNLQTAYDILQDNWESGNLKDFLSNTKVQKTSYPQNAQTKQNKQTEQKQGPKPQKTTTKTQSEYQRRARENQQKNQSTTKTKFQKSKQSQSIVKEYSPILLPSIKLRLGEYLYYTGKIEWQDFLRALRWQYKNRPKIGDLAFSMGLLSNDQILIILSKRRQGELFGETAQRLGFLDSRNVMVLCGRQKLLDLPLGKYFILQGLLSQASLTCALEGLNRHNLLIQIKEHKKQKTNPRW